MKASHLLRLTAWSTVVACSVCCCGAALAQNAEQKATDNVQRQVAAGKDVYMNARCFACHGEDGNGGVGPRFREDHFLGLADYVIGQILIGRGVMPSFADALSDRQTADVAAYIRNSWGNRFGGVHPQEVASVRDQLKVKPQQQGPHLSSNEQPPGVPAPPSSGQPPGQPLPPPNLR